MPYLQLQANLISTFFLQNLWVNVFSMDLKQFKLNTFISLIMNEDFGICPGIGFSREPVLLKFLWTMKFWNCQKTLVDDLADFSKTWTGYDAKYFEECSQSNNAEVTLFEKQYYDAKTDEIWLGTVDAKSVRHCITILPGSTTAAASDPATLLTKMAYKTFFNWAVDTYPESFE